MPHPSALSISPFDPVEHGAAPPAPNGRLPPFEPFGRTLGFGPRHSHVAAHVAARISASRLRQLLEPRTMEREEPRDYFRPHLARNIPHSHSPGQPIRALIRGRSHCAAPYMYGDDPRPLEWPHLTRFSQGHRPRPFDPFKTKGSATSQALETVGQAQHIACVLCA